MLRAIAERPTPSNAFDQDIEAKLRLSPINKPTLKLVVSQDKSYNITLYGGALGNKDETVNFELSDAFDLSAEHLSKDHAKVGFRQGERFVKKLDDFSTFCSIPRNVFIRMAIHNALENGFEPVPVGENKQLLLHLYKEDAEAIDSLCAKHDMKKSEVLAQMLTASMEALQLEYPQIDILKPDSTP